MEIELSKDTERIIKELSEKTGLYEKEIFLRAIKCYLRNTKEFPLEDELIAWNNASDEDLASSE